jgi:hypothetical protein
VSLLTGSWPSKVWVGYAFLMFQAALAHLLVLLADPSLAEMVPLGGDSACAHPHPQCWVLLQLSLCCPSPQAVEKLVQGAESGCHSEEEKQVVLNCSRLLTRVLPYIFEDPDWRGFFWSTVPGAGRGGVCGPLAKAGGRTLLGLLSSKSFLALKRFKGGE